MTSVLAALLLMIRSSVRSRAALQLEVLALRHQLRALDRSRRGRVRLTRVDRLLCAEIVKDRCVLLVDDVTTSGATLSEAAVLRAAGAGDVHAVTLCQAEG